jgi:hypothetical protein
LPEVILYAASAEASEIGTFVANAANRKSEKQTSPGLVNALAHQLDVKISSTTGTNGLSVSIVHGTVTSLIPQAG